MTAWLTKLLTFFAADTAGTAAELVRPAMLAAFGIFAVLLGAIGGCQVGYQLGYPVIGVLAGIAVASLVAWRVSAPTNPGYDEEEEDDNDAS
jgi:hypothetical protein